MSPCLYTVYQCWSFVISTDECWIRLSFLRRSPIFCYLRLRSRYTYTEYFFLFLFSLFSSFFFLFHNSEHCATVRKKKNKASKFQVFVCRRQQDEKCFFFFSLSLSVSFVFWECVDGVAQHAAIPLTSISKLIRDLSEHGAEPLLSSLATVHPKLTVHTVNPAMVRSEFFMMEISWWKL